MKIKVKNNDVMNGPMNAFSQLNGLRVRLKISPSDLKKANTHVKNGQRIRLQRSQYKRVAKWGASDLRKSLHRVERGDAAVEIQNLEEVNNPIIEENATSNDLNNEPSVESTI